MTPTEKKLALIEHITALEEDALEEVYQSLLPDEKEEDVVTEQDVQSYVLRVEVPAADWVFCELLLAKMRWEFEILLRKKQKSWEELFEQARELDWEEDGTLEEMLDDL